MDLDVLHADLATKCNDQIGIAISASDLTQMFRGQVADTLAGLAGIGWPTSLAGVSISTVADQSTLNLDFGIDGLEVLAFEMSVVLHASGDATRILSEIPLEYTSIKARVVPQKGRLDLIMTDAVGTFEPAIPGVDRHQIIADLKWTPEQVTSFENMEASIGLLMMSDIAAAFVGSVRFPQVLQAFEAFNFFGALRFEYLPSTPDYDAQFLITSQQSSEIRRQGCPGVDARVETTTRVIGGAGPTKRKIEVTFTPLRQMGQPTTEQVEAAKAWTQALYAYLPKRVLDEMFDPSLLPSIYASETGGWGPVEWSYDLTVAFRGARADVNLNDPLPVWRLDLPMRASGNARAGLKIGCIRIPLAAATLKGGISTFVVKFVPTLDSARQVLEFNAEVEKISGVTVDVDSGGPIIPWPLSLIVDLILESVAYGHVGDLVGSVVNLARLTVARFARLNSRHPRFSNLSYSRIKDASALIGVGRG